MGVEETPKENKEESLKEIQDEQPKKSNEELPKESQDDSLKKNKEEPTKESKDESLKKNNEEPLKESKDEPLKNSKREPPNESTDQKSKFDNILDNIKNIIPFKKETSRFEHYKSPSDYQLDQNGGVEGVNSIEDVMEIIGFHGKWNIITFTMIAIYTFVSPMHIITYQFLGATPDYWCQIDELIEANWTQKQVLDIAIPLSNDTKYKYEGCKYYNQNYSLAAELGYDQVMKNPELIKLNSSEQFVTCYKRDFNTSQYESTVVIEWDLVCENRHYYSTTQSASQIGILFGALSASLFLERFGRRWVILISSLLRLVTAFGAAIAPFFSFYVLMRILISTSGFAAYSGLFITGMEVSSPSQRSSVGALMGVPWGMGYMLAPGIAYFIRSWRWLQATYSCFCLMAILYFWYLPESPRWLIFRSRYDEALEVLSSAAKMNRRPLPPSEALVISMKAMTPETKEQENETWSEIIKGKLKYFFTLIRKVQHLKKILVCFFCWMAVSMVYYGVSLNSGNLSTDPYMYIFLGGLLEIPCYLIMWAMLEFLGRKVSLTGLYLTTSLTIALIAALLATMDEVSKGLLMFLSLTGKVAITAAFKVIYIFTAELFPTDIRPLAVGQSSMMARFGSISSPYINDILGDYITWAPSALFASMSFAAALLILLLPETGGTNLIERKPGGQKNDDQEKGIQMKQERVNEAFEDS